MSDKTTEQITMLNSQLKSLDAPLQTLAVTALLKTMYEAQEVRELLRERAALTHADKSAYDALVAAEPDVDPGISYEARVEKYGEEAARGHLRPRHLALERRKETMAAMDAFNKVHPLIDEISRLTSRLVGSR